MFLLLLLLCFVCQAYGTGEFVGGAVGAVGAGGHSGGVASENVLPEWVFASLKAEVSRCN